jgi:hypothetical protein
VETTGEKSLALRDGSARGPGAPLAHLIRAGVGVALEIADVVVELVLGVVVDARAAAKMGERGEGAKSRG